MTPRHIVLVQTSFERIRPILEPAAMMFYDRLFALDPSLRGMFRQSREAQAPGRSRVGSPGTELEFAL